MPGEHTAEIRHSPVRHINQILVDVHSTVGGIPLATSLYGETVFGRGGPHEQRKAI